METATACDAGGGNRGGTHTGDDAHLEKAGITRLGHGSLSSGSAVCGLLTARIRGLIGTGLLVGTRLLGITAILASVARVVASRAILGGAALTVGSTVAGVTAVLGLGGLIGIGEVLVGHSGLIVCRLCRIDGIRCGIEIALCDLDGRDGLNQDAVYLLDFSLEAGELLLGRALRGAGSVGSGLGLGIGSLGRIVCLLGNLIVGFRSLLGIKSLLLCGDRILIIAQSLLVGSLHCGSLALLHVNLVDGVLKGLLGIDESALGIGELTLEQNGLVMRGIESLLARIVAGLLLVGNALGGIADTCGGIDAGFQALILGGGGGEDVARLDLGLIQLLEVIGVAQGIIERIGCVLGGLIGSGLSIGCLRDGLLCGSSGPPVRP